MFDGALNRAPGPGTSWTAASGVTVVVYALIFLAFLRVGGALPAELELETPKVMLLHALPPPPPPPPPAAHHKTTTTPHVRKDLVVPRNIPQPLPAPPEDSSKDEAEDEGVEGGQEGGVVGGIIGGEVGGVVGGEIGGKVTAPMEYNDQMSPIRKVSGPEIEYTPKALEREIQGTMIVKCIIGYDGRVRDCRIIQGLPFLDMAVLSALSHRRYEPVTANGTPVEVEYTFKIPFHLPE
jgi:protein TonB